MLLPVERESIMQIYFRRMGKRQAPLAAMVACTCIALVMLLAACGSNTGGSGGTTPGPTTNAQTPTVTPPNDLLTAGTLTVGSDTTYPPQEYIDTTTHQAAGFDIDLITAIAARMGLQTKVITANFATIIPSLQVKRFDVVISAVR